MIEVYIYTPDSKELIVPTNSAFELAKIANLAVQKIPLQFKNSEILLPKEGLTLEKGKILPFSKVRPSFGRRISLFLN